jgi:hypothetical protein
MRVGRVVARCRYVIVAVLLAGLTLLNIGQFRGIDRKLPLEMRAVSWFRNSDVMALAYERCPRCRSRYGLYMALGTIAPGARVYIPTPNAYQAERTVADQISVRLYSYGRASSVAWVDSPLAGGPGFDPSPYIYAAGPGGAHDVAIDENNGFSAPWAIALDPAAGPARQADPYHVLDPSITAEGPHGGPPVREFVLIRWAHPTLGFARVDLLVETTLLQPTQRESLIS